MVLLDADTTPRTTMAVIHSLGRAGGYRIFAVGKASDDMAYYSRRSRYLSRPDFNWSKGPEQLDDLAENIGEAILLPISLDAHLWVAAHADELRHRWRLTLTPSPQLLAEVADKATFSTLAASLGCPVPPFVLLEGTATPLKELTFPVLLKPSDRWGGSGIVRCETEEALRSHIQKLPPGDKYMVQNYVEGESVSCSLICKEGKVLCQVTYKCLLRFADFGSFNAIERLEHPQIHSAVSQLIQGLRWTGLINLDLILGPDNRVYFLEANPRFWGNLLAMTAWGVNFVDLMCRTAMNEHFPTVQASGERFFSNHDALTHVLFKTGKRVSFPRQCAIVCRQSGIPYMLRDPMPHIFQYKRIIRDSGGLIATFRGARHLPQPLE